MTRMILAIAASLVWPAPAQAQEKAPDRSAFFRARSVDFWQEGTPAPSRGAQVESIWAEPTRMPDGRYTVYMPPRAVLEFLENPTRENARKYLAWQSERIEKMQKAASMLEEVRRKGVPEEQEATASSITYFKKPG